MDVGATTGSRGVFSHIQPTHAVFSGDPLSAAVDELVPIRLVHFWDPRAVHVGITTLPNLIDKYVPQGVEFYAGTKV